jgi:ABC-type antimicrobial peptide transport system permease subunit
MNAVHPPVHSPHRAGTVRSLVVLARVNLARNRVRTALGAAGLAVAIAATTFLVLISLGFDGAVVGTLLGDAVAIQVRAADYAAVGATLLLALLGVANVMYLNIRERGVEFATLRSLGWTDTDLNRVIAAEATGIAVLGTTAGLAIGLAGAAAFLGAVPYPAIAATTAISLAAGAAIAIIAAGAASHLTSRLPITAVLAEE